MRLSQVIIRVRDYLQDHATDSDWTDVEITRRINDAVSYAFRAQCELDETYHNHELDILGTDATELHANVFVYELPRWVHRVTRVRETKAAATRVGRHIPVTNPNSDREGYSFDLAKRLRVRDGSSADDLTVSVCKHPARLHQGTCLSNGSTTTLITPTLPTPSATAYEFEHELNAYVNAIVELTGVPDGSRDPVGQIGLVSASDRTDPAASYQIQMTFRNTLGTAPAASDTYELHPEVEDANLQFIILKAARNALMKRQIMTALEATRMEFLAEQKRFQDSISPREDGEPFVWIGDDNRNFNQDPDRDFLLGNY